MSDFRFMTTVTVTYKPQDMQTFRCSENFPNWNSPAGGKLEFKVIKPEGYPEPHFAIDHDKAGKDTRWYSALYDGRIIEVSAENGDPGEHELYVGTTSYLPKELDGSHTYKVIVWATSN